jgi:hypothetical protein
MGLSASKTAGRDCVKILLAGALGRYYDAPDGWTVDPERTLALEVLGGDRVAFKKLAREAKRLFVRRWNGMGVAA